MKELIIIKYGELTTKKDNIKFFIKTLVKNVEESLRDIDYKLEYDNGRMFIYTDYIEETKEKLRNIFGIFEIETGYELEKNDIDYISDVLKDLIKDKSFKTFKVVTKRSDKSYPITSMEISKKLGGVVLKNKKDITVDVHNPEVIIDVEIRFKKAYIYFESEKGLRGYPIGVQGKGMLMLSGGIDSPVAAFLAMKRGIRLEAVYFESPPHTSDAAKEKVKTLVRILSKYSGYIKLHVINFTEIQETIYKNAPHDYLITIMRRMMYRISERIARKNNCKVLINGESIGQVASQTLTSMAVINEVTKMPVIRPVACLDKLEIIDISKKIDTYETSILPYEDCCTIFVPKHPVINPELEKAIEYENLFDYEPLLQKAIKEEKKKKITPEAKKLEDIL